LLLYNGYDTRGLRERRELLQVLEKVLPPATPSEESRLTSQDPSVLLEREYEFSMAPPINRVLAAGLGILNLGGALYLGNLIGQYAYYGVALPGAITALYPWLLTYAVLFNAIPLVRNFWIGQANAKIQKRNEDRLGWRDRLAKMLPKSPLASKLKAAQDYQKDIKRLGASKNDIIFDTRQSMEQIQAQKEKSELDDFDKRLLQ
jgi:hypothetical protein